MARICTMVIIGLVGPPAMAQLGRVGDGRAGDANLRIGSGGQNLRSTTPSLGLGNEIMSGNVTRGRHFRGESPISSTTAFSADLGSTTLDNFVRDSVGVSDIWSGYRPDVPTRYYSPTGTVTSTGGLSVGFRHPTDRNLPSSYINLPADPLDPMSRLSDPLSRQVRILSLSDQPDPGSSEQLGRIDDSYYEPMTRGELFGVAPDAATTASPLPTGLELGLPDRASRAASRLHSQYGIPAWAGPVAPPAGPERPGDVVPPESALDRLLNRQTDESSLLGQPSVRTEEEAEQRDAISTPGSYTRVYGAPGTGAWSEHGRIEDESRASRTVAEGDVYQAMARAASMIEDIVPADPDRARAPGPRVRGLEDRAEPAEPAQPDEQAPAPHASIAKQHEDELRAMLAKPVATFTGTAKTMANKTFKEAETRLAAGRYYDAVTAYNVARAADPDNPLIWIGRGHALIGAGDYLAASASLEEGLTRFPQLARFRIDLKAFLSHGDILDIRRADLERRLDQKENYRLRFLLGYIEYFSGLEKFGLPNLKRAAGEAPTTSVFAKFPQMLDKQAPAGATLPARIPPR